jgi:hypothetical protein
MVESRKGTVAGREGCPVSVLDAHGGLARWRAFDMVEAIFMFGGQLVQTKVSPNLPAAPTTGPISRVEMSTREQSGTRTDATGPADAFAIRRIGWLSRTWTESCCRSVEGHARRSQVTI